MLRCVQRWHVAIVQQRVLTMLTINQIKIATSVLYILEKEGATFSVPGDSTMCCCSAEQVAHTLVDMDASLGSIIVEFREEAVIFSIEFNNPFLGLYPAECIANAMKVRQAFVNMSSN